MAYGAYVSKAYTAGGTPTDSTSFVDLGRAVVGGLTPVVQEVTHEVTGNGSLIRQVLTPGTRLRLSSVSLPIRKAIVQALPTNQGTVVVGDANVVAAQGSQVTPTSRGTCLNQPGVDAVAFEFDDLTDVWVDAIYGNDGVSVVYFT